MSAGVNLCRVMRSQEVFNLRMIPICIGHSCCKTMAAKRLAVPSTVLHVAFTLYLGCTGSNEGTIERELIVWSKCGLVLKAQDLDVEFLAIVSSAAIVVVRGRGERVSGGAIFCGTRQRWCCALLLRLGPS